MSMTLKSEALEPKDPGSNLAPPLPTVVNICSNNGKTDLMPCEFKKKKKKYEEMVDWI